MGKLVFELNLRKTSSITIFEGHKTLKISSEKMIKKSNFYMV